MIRPAQASDADAFHHLAAMYIAESGQGRQYSVRNTQAAFDYLLQDSGSLLLVLEGRQSLAGGTIVQIDRAFTTDPVAVITMFYVAPAYRGTPAARLLMKAVVEWADNLSCSHVFASASAELPGDATQMFINLCRKHGFVPGGPVLSRRIAP